jgi:hypothetical protein
LESDASLRIEIGASSAFTKGLELVTSRLGHRADGAERPS